MPRPRVFGALPSQADRLDAARGAPRTGPIPDPGAAAARFLAQQEAARARARARTEMERAWTGYIDAWTERLSDRTAPPTE